MECPAAWRSLLLRECVAAARRSPSCHVQPRFALSKAVNRQGVDVQGAFLAGEGKTSWPADCCYATLRNSEKVTRHAVPGNNIHGTVFSKQMQTKRSIFMMFYNISFLHLLRFWFLSNVFISRFSSYFRTQYLPVSVWAVSAWKFGQKKHLENSLYPMFYVFSKKVWSDHGKRTGRDDLIPCCG